MSTQLFTDISAVVKNYYLPALDHMLGITPSPLLEKIRKEKLPTGGKIVAAAPYGLVGGFGFGYEGTETPFAGGQKYLDFEIQPTDMYVNIEFSEKLRRLGSIESGVIIDALRGEIDGAHSAAKWNIGRALFGDGSGKLCTTSAFSSDTVTVSQTKFLQVGLIVDIYENDATTPKLAKKRIAAVDSVNKTVILEGGNSVSVGDGFMTVQNSFNREITGLGAIFDPNVTTLYGKSKASYPFITPITIDAKNAINDYILTEGINRAQRERASSIDMYLMGEKAFEAYYDYMKQNGVHIVEELRYEGGAAGFRVRSGSALVDIVCEINMPDGEIWGICTKDFKFVTTGWSFADYGGSIFQLRDNSAVYRGLLCNYGNLICSRPGGCVRIINCEKTAE